MILKEYKELENTLDQLFMEKFGRCDRNNIDVKNCNPPVLLQTIALIELKQKVEELITMLGGEKKEEKAEKETKTQKKKK